MLPLWKSFLFLLNGAGKWYSPRVSHQLHIDRRNPTGLAAGTAGVDHQVPFAGGIPAEQLQICIGGDTVRKQPILRWRLAADGRRRDDQRRRSRGG